MNGLRVWAAFFFFNPSLSLPVTLHYSNELGKEFGLTSQKKLRPGKQLVGVCFRVY